MEIKALLVVDSVHLTYERVEWNDLVRGIRINFQDTLDFMLAQFRTVDDMSTQSTLLVTVDKMTEWGMKPDPSLVEAEVELRFVSKALGMIEGTNGDLVSNTRELKSGDFALIQTGSLKRQMRDSSLIFPSQDEESVDVDYVQLKSKGNLPTRRGEKPEEVEYQSGYIGGGVLLRIDSKTRLKLLRVPPATVFSLVELRLRG